VTAEESQLFIDDCDNGKYSSMVGWVISQGKIMMDNDSRVLELKSLTGGT
jgi:hypothetical protein